MEEFDFDIPSPWPHRLAMFLGLVCLGLMVWGMFQYADVVERRAYVLTTLEAPVDPGIKVDPERLEPLRQSYKALGIERTLWGRRVLGLAIAGLILFIGGYLCAGFRKLHEGLKWQVIDDAEDARTRDDPLIFKS
jgi:hypothetical protein